MQIKISGNEVLLEQDLSLESKISIIYGENNSGKTSLLRSISNYYSEESKRDFFSRNEKKYWNYIPTNRLIYSNRQFRDYSDYGMEALIDIISTKNEREYDTHLAIIRQRVMKFECSRSFIENSIKNIFGLSNYEINNDNYTRMSDGIENIINIITEIIWTLFDENELETMNYSELCIAISKKNMLVLIDEIEMFLHVSIQIKFVNYLENFFGNIYFVFTTHSPLLLSRIKNAQLFEIADGKIEKITDVLYYQDLDDLYNSFFKVEYYPEVLKNDIDYIYKVVDRKVEQDKYRVESISKNIKDNFPNVFENLNKLLLIAKSRCE